MVTLHVTVSPETPEVQRAAIGAHTLAAMLLLFCWPQDLILDSWGPSGM